MTVLPPRSDVFEPRHNGPRAHDIDAMLKALGATSLDDLMDKALPEAIRWDGTLLTPPAASETDALAELRALAEQNEVFRSYIGMGYNGTLTPLVILRNILENPGWYTAYTPYQAEIAQGRLEMLLNFQTMVIDLTGLPCSNSSLLDEATAAAEAMTLCNRVLGRKAASRERFIVDPTCHPQTIDVVQTRAVPLGIEVIVADVASHDFGATPAFGALVQYPNTHGEVTPLAPIAKRVHDADALLVVAADLLSLALLKPPGEAGADVVVGNSQRFGVPMGFGGPHAGFMACRDEYKRQLPGRIIGVTKDAQGHQALRMAMQTREQHIRRDKATSNICTAQVLLAVIAAAYGVYHGPKGVTAIARRVRAFTAALAQAITNAGGTVHNRTYFDTLAVTPRAGVDAIANARGKRINLRPLDGGKVGISIDETVSETDLRDLIEVFGGERDVDLTVLTSHIPALPADLARTSAFMTHPVFNRYHSETEMLRYLHRLEARDLTLNTAMIPLGSCTMKLNATAEMIPVTWPGFGALHPFAPPDQTRGYMEMCTRLEAWLADITGFAACTLQPNSGAAGEYTGLLVIRAYHHERGQDQRNICLIPSSAHGTNPASATLCGMKVVVIACDDHGNIDVADLREKAAEHRENLAALMVTYPSTHGVFEPTIKAICAIVHEHGGLVYLDGANMNALVGLARPGDLGADVCHLNLHKTFCIPHGGGGPGVGPICMTAALAPFRPGHPVVKTGGERAVGAVAAAPWGSASILPISYAYIRMMGPDGLKRATQIAILNANYVAARLAAHYPILYTGQNGLCAHECILDCRHLAKSANITVVDIAKRLMDYGFHAPTMSWPVAATLMVEPTESESKEELDRFVDAMIAIRNEIREVEQGTADRENNILKHAPHTAQVVMGNAWDRPYTRERAAFPSVRPDQAMTTMPGATADAFPGALTIPFKYWPTVSRVDDVYGDRHVVCACPPVEAYATSQ